VSTTPAPGPAPGAGLAGVAVLALYGAARLRRA
jgi:MYXO-CTERM domain-containing protein